jgi:uncharacterized damage-inducible protein DinB
LTLHNPACAPYRLLARYNQWFNNRLLEVLPAAPSRIAPSLIVQINHIYVMDHLWLSRFGVSTPPIRAPQRMDEMRFKQFEDWGPERAQTDKILTAFTEHLADGQLAQTVSFVTMADGARISRELWALLTHLFNHQALHRGEILAHLSSAGVEFGQSDVLPLTGETIEASKGAQRTT